MSIPPPGKYLLVFLFTCTTTFLSGQTGLVDSSNYIRVRDINARTFSRNDTVWVYSGLCKTQRVLIFTGEQAAKYFSVKETAIPERKLFLSAQGELQYQHFRRESDLDDLALLNSQSDIALLRLSLVFKENYPFAFSFRYNKSRPFQLDDQYEITLGADKRNYKELIRNKLINGAKKEFESKSSKLFALYNKLFTQWQKVKRLHENPAYVQNIVQERMRQNRPGAIPQSLPGMPSLNNIEVLNSVPSLLQDSLGRMMETVKNRVESGLVGKKDSLLLQLLALEDSIVNNGKEYTAKVDSVNNKIAGLDSYSELEKYASGLQDSLTPPKRSFFDIMMRTELRVGKFIANNSELTVNNIFLHGASIKYGDRFFVQLSAGYYDFAFRSLFNFRGESNGWPKTSVLAVKLGKETENGVTAINFYTGKKQQLGSVTNELRGVAGMSVQKTIFLNKNINVEMELAKSTAFRNSGTDKSESTLKELFSNYNLKTIGASGMINAYLPKSKTDIAFTYRYWGAQFESFNANQYFNPQNNISLKAAQSLFRRKVSLTAGVRMADFKNYTASSNIRSKTIFANASATIRLKKLPVISVGYYPGSQLYWLEQDKLYEYYYYILNATASHYFKVGRAPFQVTATYNKFYNRYTDSLVAGAQSYYSVFASTWINKFSFQLNYSYQELSQSLLKTLETGMSYTNEMLRLGGSLKWNKASQDLLIGYTGNVGITIKKIGMLGFVYDKSYLPDRAGKFVPVHIGQVQFTKPLKFNIWQKG